MQSWFNINIKHTHIFNLHFVTQIPIYKLCKIQFTIFLLTLAMNYCLVHRLDNNQRGVFRLGSYTAVSYIAWCPPGAVFSTTRKWTDFVCLITRERIFGAIPPSTLNFQICISTSVLCVLSYMNSVNLVSSSILKTHKISLLCSRGWKIGPWI